MQSLPACIVLYWRPFLPSPYCVAWLACASGCANGDRSVCLAGNTWGGGGGPAVRQKRKGGEILRRTAIRARARSVLGESLAAMTRRPPISSGCWPARRFGRVDAPSRLRRRLGWARGWEWTHIASATILFRIAYASNGTLNVADALKRHARRILVVGMLRCSSSTEACLAMMCWRRPFH